MNIFKASAALLLLSGLNLKAATVALGTSGADPNNFGTFSG
ncbi:hypothetical protein P3T73_16680 [Kiritimatiellota bacterium B12222]|nr:hypothetical protein P3T73_16680 [Kiritimatiellota bacterium B12222]